MSKLQRELNALQVANLSVDGQFGANTKAAVEHFQQDAFPSDSSQWDGQVGPHTWGALGQCHSSGGVTGGGCNTSPDGASACISWNSGTVIPDGYLLTNDITHFYLERIINGSVYTNPCVMIITGVPINDGYHIASPNCNISAGSSSGDSYVSVLIFGYVDSDGNVIDFTVISPVQYV